MSIKTILHDFYDLTRLPLGIMGALFGFTSGAIVVMVEEQMNILSLFSTPKYWPITILGLTIPFLIVGASMAINDYHDYEADRINSRMDRPLVRNPNLNPNIVLFLALSMIALGILISYLLFANNILVVLGVILFSFLGISYNLWTKERGILGNITVAISDTAPALLALIAMEAKDKGTIFLVFVMAGITFFGVVGRELVKGIMDIEGDRAANSRTFAVVYGPKRAVQLASFFFIIVIFISPLPLFIKFQNSLLYLLFMSVTITLLLFTVIMLYNNPSIEKGKKARSLTRSALWTGAIAFLIGALELGFRYAS
ncbi:UbiA family prenyltransferase [Candidatus Hodarchaeum mangrovi]